MQAKERRFKLLPPCRDETLEFLEPILDEDHFSHRLGCPRTHMHHKESLAVRRHVKRAYRTSQEVICVRDQKARFACRKTGIGSDVHGPKLVLPSVEQLSSVRCPGILGTAFVGYLPPA